MSANIAHVTDASFETDVLKSDAPVLVDYWAEWCGPCKMVAPVLEELAKSYGDKLKIAKMDVDANQEVPAKHNIRGIPTLMLFKGGQVVATKVGAMSKSQLTAFIDSHI
ncbi:MAG: thioredoxin TrxA [Burkholderiales bacterium]|nr:thioredoxin TrxA [Burkholderiales bacterium]